MPSSYTTSLRLTLPATGELTGTWGTTVNTGITELLDAAVAGTTTISTWGGAGVAYTLSNTDGAADEARKMFIVATGAPGEAKNVICPAVSKLYFFRNDTTGGFALTLKTSGGSGIAVPAGQYKVLYCNGTNVVEAFNSLASLTLGTALAASSGGTGQSTYTTGDLLYASGASALSKLGIGASTTILTSSGTAPQWTAASSVAIGTATNLAGGAAGSVPYQSGAATTTFLGIGAANTVMTSSGTAPQWSTALTGLTGVSTTTATLSGNLTLSGGTANGVLYLDGSKVATSGSALTFDGTTLSNTGSGDRAKFGTGSRNIYIAGDSTGVSLLDGAGQTGNGWYINGASNYVAGYIGSSEQMRLTSTGLGIGTSSPGYKLDVSGVGKSSSAFAVGDSSGNLSGTFTNESDVSKSVTFNADPGNVGASSFMRWNVDGSERMRLDASGNLGIGGTPSAWSGYNAFQIGDAGSTPLAYIASDAAGNTVTNIGHGAYWNGSNWLYTSTSVGATRYQMTGANAGSTHAWFISAGGTAGNAISFTQAMTLDASGQLGIGTTSPQRSLHINGSVGAMRLQGSSVGGYIEIVGPTTTNYIGTPAAIASGSTTDLGFYLNGAERARITSGGQLVLNSGAAGNQLQFWDTGAVAECARLGINASNGLDFAVGSTTPRMTITSTGNVVAGGSVALATTATDGFLYVPTCAGTPTGTPTAITGMAPIVVDTTNNKLYFYSGGAWRDAGP